jgi:hypothetical protein
MQEYTIPRVLWESLDAVLRAKGIALAKEIAKELGKPSQPLINVLTTKERSKFTLISDDDANRYQCQALVKTGAVYMRCRSVLLGSCTKLCDTHQGDLIDIPTNLPIMTRVIGKEGIYMADMTTKEVFSLRGVQCGRIHGNRLTLFEITD